MEFKSLCSYTYIIVLILNELRVLLSYFLHLYRKLAADHVLTQRYGIVCTHRTYAFKLIMARGEFVFFDVYLLIFAFFYEMARRFGTMFIGRARKNAFTSNLPIDQNYANML